MKSYAIWLRRHGLDIDRDVAVVKEGFSWPAFFFTALWASWSRLWLAAAIYIFAQCLLYLFFLLILLDPLSQGLISLGLAVIFGYVASDFRQKRLSKEGFELCAVVQGKNGDQAYRQFLLRSPIIVSDLKT